MGPATEEFFKLQTSDGVFLDAGLTLPELPESASLGVVVCHPDPRGGGTMYNALIETIVQTLGASGVAALRFDFRVPGSFDERLLDASAALVHLRSRLPEGGRTAMVGWSMGAEIALAVAGSDPGVESVVAICPLLFPNLAPRRESLRDRRVLLLVPEFDQFTPPDVARQRIDFGTLEVIADGDHSLFGREEEIAERVMSFLTGA
ncbi:MAG: alpha/beta hydrolase [Acidimicrobiia bacterium]